MTIDQCTICDNKGIITASGKIETKSTTIDSPYSYYCNCDIGVKLKTEFLTSQGESKHDGQR